MIFLLFQKLMKNRHKKIIGILFLSGTLVFLSGILAGCSTPEGGSSMPWSQPEPWEQKPRIGVPY